MGGGVRYVLGGSLSFVLQTKPLPCTSLAAARRHSERAAPASTWRQSLSLQGGALPSEMLPKRRCPNFNSGDGVLRSSFLGSLQVLLPRGSRVENKVVSKTPGLFFTCEVSVNVACFGG